MSTMNQNQSRMTIERLNATSEAEKEDLMRGYLDGKSGAAAPEITSDFYDHGRRQALNGDIDCDQRRLAWETVRLGRSASEREWAEECLRRGDVEGYSEAQERHHAAFMAELAKLPTLDQAGN